MSEDEPIVFFSILGIRYTIQLLEIMQSLYQGLFVQKTGGNDIQQDQVSEIIQKIRKG